MRLYSLLCICLLTCGCLFAPLAPLRAADAPPKAVTLPDPMTVLVPGGDNVAAALPATYADEKGFQQRGKLLVAELAKIDLLPYRSGSYFGKGGDPGKYIPGPAMARLLVDPSDADSLKYMNDDRSPKEVYHFAVVNWARFLPLFHDSLTPETIATLTANLAKASMLARDEGPGTENHVVMQISSGVVLSDWVKTDRFAGMSTAAAKTKAKEWLRGYVKNLYQYGQGEWDSSTYMPYDINAMLNIYDFSKDEECRLLARAALDWYATAYALKYVNGMHTGPKERGWTTGIGHGLDSTGLLWWGSTNELTEKVGWDRTAMHSYTSGYRPNAVISNIAHRQLPVLPAEFRNSKPNYWTGLDKAPIPPIANVSQESLYVTPHYTLGSMWYSEDVCTQLIRLQLGAATKEGAVSFTGCAPGSYNGEPRYFSGQGTHITRPAADYGSGNVTDSQPPKTIGLYTQYAQVGPTLICMACFPADAKEQFTYFTTPVPAEKIGDWYLMQAGETFVAVRPLTATAEVTTLAKEAALVFPGAKSGFILQTGDTSKYATKEAFIAALTASQPDLTAWPEQLRVSCRTLDGRALTMQYATGKQQAAVTVNDVPVSYQDWPVYGGPYVTQQGGVLTVNDGVSGFAVDFTGDLPVYKTWKP